MLHDPVGQRAVVIVTAQGRITTGGQHLKNAFCQTQDRDVERTATQIVDRVNALAGIVQSISDGRSSGLIDETQHLQTGHLRRVLRCLALRVVKIGRHRDHRAVQIVSKSVFGAITQRGQNIGTDLNRRLFTLYRLHAEHATVLRKTVRQFGAAGHIGQAAPHETLDRGNGVFRVLRRRLQRIKADLPTPAFKVTNDRRQDHPTLTIGQAFGHTVPHGSHQ